MVPCPVVAASVPSATLIFCCLEHGLYVVKWGGGVGHVVYGT